MYEIHLKDAGKRYNRDWIFRKLSLEIPSGRGCAILGGNGSGKSTLLRSILGYAPLSEGEILYFEAGRAKPRHQVYRDMSFSGPYLELYEELTLAEMIRFHFSLKSPLPGLRPEELARRMQLEPALHRPVKFFSSGMKQRLRLALAIFSQSRVLLLDEPASNLDRKAIDWYQSTLQEHLGERILLVASNHQEAEYALCTQKINVEEYKP